MNNLSDGPRGGTMCLGKVTLAIGDGAKTGPALTVASFYAINGRAYVTTAAATVKPLTAAAVQAVSTTCMYLICIDKDGTVTSVKGREILTSALTNGTDVLEWPLPTSDDVAAVGAVRVETDSTHTFTPGTTALDAAGITETYYDIACGIPHEPLTA